LRSNNLSGFSVDAVGALLPTSAFFNEGEDALVDRIFHFPVCERFSRPGNALLHPREWGRLWLAALLVTWQL
jgi:hypothetical protein